jgi:hypothetical protein
MLIEDFEDYYKEFANYTGKKLGMDYPKLCFIDTEWWYDYPIQDFDYQFNSWGFRGPEYTQYIGKPVNICLGDSFTVNLGGPIEHSWCSLLSAHFDIPTLNLGMDGAGNDAIKIVYDRACELFDVQNTFVMYSYLHRRVKNNTFEGEEFDLDKNIDCFNKNFINRAHYTFLPFWNWTNDELDYIRNNHKNNFYNLLSLNLEIPYEKIDKDFYKGIKGDDWITWESYTKDHYPNEIMQSDELYNQILSYPYVNRDGHHCNEIANKFIADFLWDTYNAT